MQGSTKFNKYPKVINRRKVPNITNETQRKSNHFTMSSKSCHLLPSTSAMNRVLLMLALVLASAAAHRLQQFTSPEAAPTSGDKMSSADGSEPPRRFHAIFQGSSAAAAMAELKSSPSSLEKMLAGSSSSSSGSRRSKVAVDNSTSDNASSQKNRTRQCREGCLGKVIIISLSNVRGREAVFFRRQF